ncbi:MAG TPA: Gfo/Idh/MocA family oxidoreductase [Phototrophicaceae bacterium]|nr:Gfo/Idh/MocA family oxidoreductase [Phototrophicaceae bacterium]
MDNKIRWGVISTANIGAGQVIPAIQQSSNGVVTAVASRDLDKATAFAARLNIPKAYGSYEALIADPEIDAIYNPLPNGLHGEWSIRCAEGGKPVLCEKPLANDAAEAQTMVDAFKERNLLLAEAFMYRFHPQTAKVKELVDGGAVGKIQIMQASFTFSISRENNVRLSKELVGGALMDVGCYCVSAARYMIGEEPSEVQALAGVGERSGVDEKLVGLLRFPGGALAHFDCGLRTHFAQTYEIRGSHGRILVEKAFVPFRPNPADDVVIRWWKSEPGIEKHQYEEIKVEKPNPYTLMVEDFADALLNHRAPRFPIEDSIAQMRAIDMLYSAAEMR